MIAVGCAIGAYALGVAGATSASIGKAGTLYTMSNIMASSVGADSAFAAFKLVALASGATVATTLIIEEQLQKAYTLEMSMLESL